MTHEEWLEERRKGIGASDAPIILGLSPWSSPLKLYAQKLGLLPDPEETEAMEWGKRLEPVIAQKYYEETGRGILINTSNEIVRHPEYNYLLATLDAWITEAERDPLPAPLEIKTASASAAKHWVDGVPKHYWVQVQHQMMVTGSRWASVAVLFGGQEFKWCDVERDDEFINGELLPALHEFWRRIQEQDPPPPEADDRPALNVVYEEIDEDEPVAFPAEVQEWDEELAQVKEQLKILSERKRLLENKIIAALGGRKAGVLPNGTLYTYTKQLRKETLVKASEFYVLRRREPKGG